MNRFNRIKTSGGLAVIIILIACLIAIVAVWSVNRSSAVGPAPSGGGSPLPTSTPAPTATPQTLADTGALLFDARKGSAGTIAKGAPVYLSGYNVGGWIEVEEADSDAPAQMPGIGIANVALTNSSTGTVMLSGELTDVNTSAFSVGDELWISTTSGTLTATKPTGTAAIQKIAQVARDHAVNGVLTVFGAGRSNDVPNIADDSIWIGSSAQVATASVIPDCATALIYTQSTNTIGCAAGGGGADLASGLAIDAASTPTSSDVSGVPNVDLQGSGSAFPVAGDTYYEPFNVLESIDLNRVSLERTDANPAQDCSVGIYTATENWQPLALEADFSPLTLAGGGGAWNHKTISHTLAPGSYLSAYQCNGAPLGTFPGVTSFSRALQNLTSFGVTYTDWRATTPSISPATPFPASPAAGDLWDNFTLQGTADNGYWRLMFRWTTTP